MYWNLCGIANTSTQLALRNMCAKEKPNLLSIAKPMINASSIHAKFWRLCSLKLALANDGGTLCQVFGYIAKREWMRACSPDLLSS